MSSGPNYRRGHGRIQNHGPTWENRRPGGGCNSTHVARARSTWRKLGRRAVRRTGDPYAGGTGHRNGSKYRQTCTAMQREREGIEAYEGFSPAEREHGEGADDRIGCSCCDCREDLARLDGPAEILVHSEG